MAQRLQNYLRKFRKISALSQEEVTFLLGAHGGAKVCRHEQFLRVPNLETALAYQAIFRRPVSELFPGMYQRMEAQVQARAKVLFARHFKHLPAQTRNRKRQALGNITCQSSENLNQS